MMRNWLMALAAVLAAPCWAAGRPITVEDVLAIERLDRVSVSPDGALVAATILRGAGEGEVYGRTFHELDPSRADVIVIDRESGARRNVTDGRADAAGHWCATWSPDGERLAMLSTRAEGAEPRGGDNVRLYIWERRTGALRRLGNRAVTTQTRAGGSMRQLDMAAPGKAEADPCATADENPPFVWLDTRRLLVAALPDGQVSGLLDETDRVYARAQATRAALRAGRAAPVSDSGSGGERTMMDAAEHRAILAIVDAGTGAWTDLADVPAYPFQGSLGVRVSPDGRHAVVLATTAMVPWRADMSIASLDLERIVAKRLGVVALRPGQAVRWLALPKAATLPLRLGGWDKKARTLAFTARGRDTDTEAADFALDPATGAIRAAAPVAAAAPAKSPALPPGALLVAGDKRGLVWREATPSGLYVRAAGRDGRAPRDLLRLSAHLADVDPGETQVVDYVSADGAALKGVVLLPPGYVAGRRLPVIAWVYGGYSPRERDDYMLDPYMPGLYNLRLYAARGYAVLIPSIPLKRDGSENHLQRLAPVVLPAVDRLVALGIADADRIGVMGQSYGGFTTLGLVTQTGRFRAAVALASISDLTGYAASFDPSGSGYRGIDHEKSSNMPIAEAGVMGLRRSFVADPEGYRQASPLTFVDRVTTPVLLIHGEYDARGTAYQSEAFFNGLWRQGKTARLLRYAGENHALALSPATVRSVADEIFRWFDKYLAPREP